MTTTCRYCHAETTNGLSLCALDQRRAGDRLDMLPVYFRNLARQKRPGRPNGSLGSAGQWLIRHGEADPSTIIPALERALNDLGGAARFLADDRDLEIPTGDTEAEMFTAICDFLADHLTSIATLDWAGIFVHEVVRHEEALRKLTETAVPGWYAGTCRQVTGHDMEGNLYRCGANVYVIPGLTWVTCPGCGTTTYARDHLEIVLDEARGWVAPPMRIAEALVALIDTEQSVARLHKRISKWGEARRRKRKIDGEEVIITTPPKLAPLRRLDSEGDPVGAKRFRFGEVFDLLLKEGATRPEGDGKSKVARCA